MFYDFFIKRKRTKLGSMLTLKALEKWAEIAMETSPVKILEIGVGLRLFYEQLKKRNPQMEYIGIEASDALYEEAKSNGLNVIKCFVPPFPKELKKNDFDFVVMMHVLEHFRDFREALSALKEINELLKPNGRLMLVCPCARDYGVEFFDIDYSHSFITTENRIHELLKDTGFYVIKSDSYRACFNRCKWFFYIVSKIINCLVFFLRNGSYGSIKMKITLAKNIVVVAAKPQQSAPPPPPPPPPHTVVIYTYIVILYGCIVKNTAHRLDIPPALPLIKIQRTGRLEMNVKKPTASRNLSFRQTFRALFVMPLRALCYKWRFLNSVWMSLEPWYHYLFQIRKYEHYSDDPVSFYNLNASRVVSVCDMLADDLSKKIYLDMINFRSSRKRKDFTLPLFREEQYFFKELKFCDGEVFIDAGAYIGDTIVPFISRCPNYKSIIAFEPDSLTFAKLKKKHGNNSRITLMNAGLYDFDGAISFDGGKGGGSKITEDSDFTNRVNVKTIDGLDLEKITFIKMDIEGAELNALKGAEKTILRDKPKLAICIYHSDEDMIRIAEYIHELVPSYKLYVRQYGFVTETVLYAIAQ